MLWRKVRTDGRYYLIFPTTIIACDNKIVLIFISGQSIKYEQFKACMLKYLRDDSKNAESSEKELQASFKVFDKDNNGTIDKNELKKVLTSLGEKLKDSEVDEMFKAADVNSDGKIQYKGRS